MSEITQPLFPLNKRVFFFSFSLKPEDCFKHLNIVGDGHEGGGDGTLGLAWKATCQESPGLGLW